MFMKVSDVFNAIKKYEKSYPDLMDWDVYTEQCTEIDKNYKKNGDWYYEEDSEGWEYLKCEGFYTLFPEKKIFTINVNY
jgi:hypothetical protein